MEDSDSVVGSSAAPSDTQASSTAHHDRLQSPITTTSNITPTSIKSNKHEGKADVPPKYTINISLPPRERYVKLAKDFQANMVNIPNILSELPYQEKMATRLVKLFTPVLLRRLHSHEQTEELKGISKTVGVSLYHLVAFNVLLDWLMGHTSGGMRVKEKGSHDGSKMVHFRTVDWGIDWLRKLVVQLDYVLTDGGGVIARSITYVGFVEIHTGVRPGLSGSLNFRYPHNNDDSRRSNIKFYSHILLILAGFRPSVSSILRELLVPETVNASKDCYGLDVGRVPKRMRFPSKLANIRTWLPSIPTTVAYLTLCNGEETIVFENDGATAHLTTSNKFVVATNHDETFGSITRDRGRVKWSHTVGKWVVARSTNGKQDQTLPIPTGERRGLLHDTNTATNLNSTPTTSIYSRKSFTQNCHTAIGETLRLGDDIARKFCLQVNWEKKLDKQQRKKDASSSSSSSSSSQSLHGSSNTSSATTEGVNKDKRITEEQDHKEQQEREPRAVPLSRLISWIQQFPTTNSHTHFSAIMDPTTGQIIWRNRFLEEASEVVD